MKKYKYNINNLDCANCAREIEEELNKDKRLNNVSVNFNTCKISYESEEDISLKELNKLVRKVEPEVVVTLDEVNEKKVSYSGHSIARHRAFCRSEGFQARFAFR